MVATVDEAMKVALAGSDMAQSTQDTEPTVEQQKESAVGPERGPLTEQQAEKLIDTAISSAVTFADVMTQIVARKAWEPLGYTDPRHMMRERFSGKLINPRTGEPYGDSYIRRMSNTAWVLWSLADSTGLDPANLRVTTSVLAQIPSGVAGHGHEQLVDRILEEVDRRGASSEEEIQEVIDETMEASREAGRAVAPPPREDDDTTVEDASTVRKQPQADSDMESVPPSPTEASGANDRGEDSFARYGDADDADTHDDVDAFTGTPTASTSSAATATEAFDDDFGRGSQAPESSMSMADALGAMRQAEKATSDVAVLSGFPQQLSDVVEQITATVPTMVASITATIEAGKALTATAKVDTVEGLFDGFDVEELDALRDRVEQAMASVPAVETAAAALAHLDDGEELPGVGKLSAAAKAMDQASEALGTLENFLDEIDFVEGGL